MSKEEMMKMLLESEKLGLQDARILEKRGERLSDEYVKRMYEKYFHVKDEREQCYDGILFIIHSKDSIVATMRKLYGDIDKASSFFFTCEISKEENIEAHKQERNDLKELAIDKLKTYEEKFDSEKVEEYLEKITDRNSSVSRDFCKQFKDSLRTLKEWSNL